MYALIKDIIGSEEFLSLDVVIHQPLRWILKNIDMLTKEELKYANNCGTHLDFMIYNKMNKQPVLAIEVDGYNYHKEGTKQAERDKLKNSIMKKLGIEIIRLKTNESSESDRIKKALRTVLNNI